jgi:hypothetical protein
MVDVYGRAIDEPIRIYGDGVTSVRKNGGGIAIVSAAGLEPYTASFTAPSSPAIGSRRVALDLEPASPELSPRRFELRLPRDADPEKANRDGSIFRAIEIQMLPGPGARLTGSACALRVAVRRKSDKKLVENALVRARSENEEFEARGLTNARGEATLIFPVLPIAFPGAGANLRSDLDARVAVTVDTTVARFNSLASSSQPVLAGPPFVDPDELASIAADFAGGAPVKIAAGREVPLKFEWAP